MIDFNNLASSPLLPISKRSYESRMSNLKRNIDSAGVNSVF